MKQIHAAVILLLTMSNVVAMMFASSTYNSLVQTRIERAQWEDLAHKSIREAQVAVSQGEKAINLAEEWKQDYENLSEQCSTGGAKK